MVSSDLHWDLVCVLASLCVCHCVCVRMWREREGEREKEKEFGNSLFVRYPGRSDNITLLLYIEHVYMYMYMDCCSVRTHVAVCACVQV
jgi:hypothetical protein